MGAAPLSASLDLAMSERGRLFQDTTFEVSDMAGCSVERLFGFAEDSAGRDRPVVVWLKVRGRHWQRFILDAGFGVWEELPEETMLENHGELHLFDYGRLYGLEGQIIKSVGCSEFGRNGVAISLYFS